MILYKLTDSFGYTRNRTRWELGTIHEVSGLPKLCTNTVLHAYTSPLLAALMHPGHADYENPQCFIVEGEVCVSDGTKVGCQKLIVTDTFKLPIITIVQRIAFGILCALKVYKEENFVTWANNWLENIDRSYSAAATVAATYAANAATYAANAAFAATYAANAAFYATYAAYSATYAANAAFYAAYAAYSAYAATYATYSTAKIDFQKLAEKAMEYK